MFFLLPLYAFLCKLQRPCLYFSTEACRSLRPRPRKQNEVGLWLHEWAASARFFSVENREEAVLSFWKREARPGKEISRPFDKTAKKRTSRPTRPVWTACRRCTGKAATAIRSAVLSWQDNCYGCSSAQVHINNEATKKIEDSNWSLELSMNWTWIHWLVSSQQASFSSTLRHSDYSSVEL